MSKINYQAATFSLSAFALAQLPSDDGIEVAFIGRSNAGKSSALNTIVGKKIARVSKTPGRTQSINVFVLNHHHRLIDLPGYGYAKVPKEILNKWQQIVNQYLQRRTSLRGLILLMDIRHPLNELDRQLLQWAAECNLAVHVLLTKIDKLKKAEVRKKLEWVKQEIEHYGKTTLQTFSAVTHEGLEETLVQLDEWFSEG